MPKQRLTDASLRALRPGESQIDYWCTTLAGFGVRVSPGGRKTFMVRYRLGARYRRVKLGVYPELSLSDARRRARQVVGEVASDRDPAQARRDARLAPTFEVLANLYLEKHARVKKRSWKEDRRVIQNELFPAWRAVRATEIRRRDIRTLIEKVAERPAPSMANRIQALIHKMFNFAIAHEIVEFNPCAQLEHPAKERPRDRVLTDAEIREFWSVMDREPPDIAAAFRLRLITAQRGGEVHGMRWVDVDLDGRWWTIPGSVAKNGLAHRVPLSDLALEVLCALRDRQTTKSAASGYVLSAAARDPRRRRPALARLGLSDFRGHDLRRTAASRMASAGCSRLVIGKVLNHAEPGVTAVYDRHTYDAEKRQALQTWARSLRALLDADSASGTTAGRRAVPVATTAPGPATGAAADTEPVRQLSET